MPIPKSKRKESQFEVFHHFTQMRKKITDLLLRDFGYSFEKFNKHLIRHTTATDALERGMNIAEVQKILGHEKMDTTMIYAKVCQENVKHDHKRYIV